MKNSFSNIFVLCYDVIIVVQFNICALLQKKWKLIEMIDSRYDLIVPHRIVGQKVY